MPTSAPTPSSPDRYPGVGQLDDLELHRTGVIPVELVDLGAGPARIVDAEGVQVALVDPEGRLTWGSVRSARPFEALHKGPGRVAPPVSLVDSAVGLDAVPPDTSTLVVLASTDGEDNAADLALVRTARRAADQIGADLVVAPLGRHALRRSDKLRFLRAAYTPTYDLTSEELPQLPEPPRPGGLVIFFTGLSGSGKSTLARAVHHYLVEETGLPVSVLDGDVVRRHLSKGLTFSAEDRDTNIRRIGWVAAEIARHGGMVICSPIAPFDATRKEVRRMVEKRGGRFLLVHVDTPLEECERRDRKGLYAAARRGEVPEFTGISSPYEVPEHADLRLDTTDTEVEALRDAVLDVLRGRDWLAP